MKNDCGPLQKTSFLKKIITSRKILKIISGIIIGGLAGFLVFYFIGCNGTSCAITSNPYSSIITGSLLGYLVTDSKDMKCNSNESE